MTDTQRTIIYFDKKLSTIRSKCVKNYIKIALAAMKKRIPKKPTTNNLFGTRVYYCPDCRKIIDYLEESSTHVVPVAYGNCYCSQCGQALDWSGIV